MERICEIRTIITQVLNRTIAAAWRSVDVIPLPLWGGWHRRPPAAALPRTPMLCIGYGTGVG
jgi:hypothetical protein